MPTDAHSPSLDTGPRALGTVLDVLAELLDTGEITVGEVRSILSLIHALVAERDALRASIVRTDEALIRLQKREDPPDGTHAPEG